MSMDDTTTVVTPPKRGRGRPPSGRDTPLTLDVILDGARIVIQDGGLEALSMRKLASDIGVTPRALYNHVPSKPELLQRLIEAVWQQAVDFAADPDADAFEWIIGVNLHIRRTWIEHIELANLAVAVAEVDDTFYSTNQLTAFIFEAAGFTDVPLAYNAVLTFTMGSVALRANRMVSSTYFGRDPSRAVHDARRQLDDRGASDNLRGVTEARFDSGDDAYFEPCLRAILIGLLGA